jgi:hypothetical protein
MTAQWAIPRYKDAERREVLLYLSAHPEENIEPLSVDEPACISDH